MRPLLVGSLALLLLASLAAPALSGDGAVRVTRLAADGSASPAWGSLVDVPARRTLQAQGSGSGEGSAPPPPIDPAVLEQEKLRPTRDIAFYGHVFGLGMQATARADGEFGPDGPQAANTIFPKGDANLGLGQFDWCTDLASYPQGEACDKDPNNKVALFLTAGPVQVHQRDDFRYSKLHNEHGRTKDVVLDQQGTVAASIWMSLDYHAWSVGNAGDDTFCIEGLPRDIGCPYPYWGWDPAVWPQWVVEATLYMVELGDYGQGASEPPPIFESWAANAMTVVASGSVGPQDVTNGVPGSPNVHEFVIDLGNPQVDVVPKTMDLILVYNFYSVTPVGKVAAHTWRVWAGEMFPATFSLPVKNPLDVELVIPQFIHDKLLVHSVLASAWGSYDVDVGSARLTITDASNRPVEARSLSRVGDFQVAHGAHFKPVNVTWIWDYQADRLAPGAYKVLVEVCNQQGSACESTEAAFAIGSDLKPTDVIIGRKGQRTVSDAQLAQITEGTLQSQGSPAPPRVLPEPDAPARSVPFAEAPLLAIAAAGAALAARRRWSR